MTEEDQPKLGVKVPQGNLNFFILIFKKKNFGIIVLEVL